MEVDFNHVRRIAIDSFSDLVKTLRKRRDGDTISVRVWEIETCIDDLRSAITTIGASYLPDDKRVAVVLKKGEVLPALNYEESADSQ